MGEVQLPLAVLFHQLVVEEQDVTQNEEQGEENGDPREQSCHTQLVFVQEEVRVTACLRAHDLNDDDVEQGEDQGGEGVEEADALMLVKEDGVQNEEDRAGYVVADVGEVVPKAEGSRITQKNAVGEEGDGDDQGRAILRVLQNGGSGMAAEGACAELTGIVTEAGNGDGKAEIVAQVGVVVEHILIDRNPVVAPYGKEACDEEDGEKGKCAEAGAVDELGDEIVVHGGLLFEYGFSGGHTSGV